MIPLEFLNLLQDLVKTVYFCKIDQPSNIIKELGWSKGCSAWTEEYHVMCHVMIPRD